MKNRFLLAAIFIPVLAIALSACRQAAAPGTGSGGDSAAPASAVASAPTVTPLPDEAFRVEWGKPDVPGSLKPGQIVAVKVPFKNTSTISWPDPATASPDRSGVGAVRLSYRWWPRDHAKPLANYEVRADLARPLTPGAPEILTLEVLAPASPGSYLLQFDLVQELHSWFEDKGAARLEVPVRVE